jgi:hypothetical protein
MAKVQQQSQKPAKSSEPAVATAPVETPFRYYVPGEKPKTDQAYFELLILKLLRANGDIANFDEVWPRSVQSLAGMNLLRLSTYATHDVREAIAAVGGEFSTRMSGHAESIILWAGSMWRIRQIYGTFRRYIRSFETDGFEVLLEDLKTRLPGLSSEFLTAFLRDASEKVPVPERQPGGRPPQQQRPSGSQETRGGEQQRRQPQQQQPQKQEGGESGRGDRRRRQRGRGGARPPQQQAQQGTKTQQPLAVVAAPSEAKASGEENPKDPQQQQRRRNRRRFFRRRRPGGGGDKSGAAPAAE